MGRDAGHNWDPFVRARIPCTAAGLPGRGGVLATMALQDGSGNGIRADNRELIALRVDQPDRIERRVTEFFP